RLTRNWEVYAFSMNLLFLLDESIRGGGLWQAIQDHNNRRVDVIDVVRVGDPPDLPLGTLDPAVLAWAERASRIVVTLVRSTMPVHLATHVQAGNFSPGVFIIRVASTVTAVVDFLVEAAHRSTASSWENRIEFIP